MDFVVQFLPNRAYSKIWRVVAVGTMLVGALMMLPSLNDLYSQWNMRRNWLRAEGRIVNWQIRSARENDAPGGNPSLSARRWMYWVEYEIDFAPANGCRTDSEMSPADSSALPCIASLHTMGSYSPSSPDEWLLRHRLGMPIIVMYDPGGPGVRLAHESIIDLLPWQQSFESLAALFVGLFGFRACQQRLMDLAYLPPGEDLPAPNAVAGPKGDDLTDLNLS